MEDFQLFRRDIFRQAGVPSLVGLQHFGIDVQHLLRGMYLVLSPVLLVGDAGDVAVLLQMGQGPGHGAFVQAQRPGELVLGTAWRMADVQHEGIVIGAQVLGRYGLLSVCGLAAADVVQGFHDSGHVMLLYWLYLQQLTPQPLYYGMVAVSTTCLLKHTSFMLIQVQLYPVLDFFRSLLC